MSMKSLLIIGAGGHGKVVAETARECGYTVAFVDDRSPEAVGSLSQLEMLAPQYDAIFIAIGNNEMRRKITERMQGFNLPTLIHPTAYISPSASVDSGTFIAPQAAVNANTTIGPGCIISIGAIIDHDSTIGSFSHINSGVICKSGSKVGDLIKIDSGTIVEGY